MKKSIHGFRAKTMLCGLCLALSTTVLNFWSSFIFLGEPEIPECLKEE
jgi:hypothetical protein